MRILFLVLSATSALRLRSEAFLELSSGTSAQAAERAERKILGASWASLVKELQELQSTALHVPTEGLDQRADEIVASKIGAVDAASKSLSGKALLMPALGMLNGMYSEQKERIGEINKQERKSKDRFSEQEKHHEQVLAHYKDLLDHHKISQGLYDNETAEANHIYSYWSRSRDRAHHMFHTQLKLTHGLMSKEKGMISAYNKALSESKENGKISAYDKVFSEPSPTKNAAAELSKAQHEAVPSIVLLQGRELAEYCKEAMSTAKKEMASLEEPAASFSPHASFRHASTNPPEHGAPLY